MTTILKIVALLTVFAMPCVGDVTTEEAIARLKQRQIEQLKNNVNQRLATVAEPGDREM